MAALNADRKVDTYQYLTDIEGIKAHFPVAASTVIYAGGFVGLNTAGYLKMYSPPVVGTSIVGGDRFVGLALDHVDQPSTDGAAKCEVLIGGRLHHALSGATAADVGKPVYASDDNTLSLINNGNARVGRIVRQTASGMVIVSMDAYLAYENPIAATSPEISCTALNKVIMIHPTMNSNGLYISQAAAVVREVFGGATQDQGRISLQDTDGTALNIAFLPSDAAADAVEDVIAQEASNTKLYGAATGVALTKVAAGKGVQAAVTQVTSGAGAAGKMKIYLQAESI
jgi:hypothetical protein